VKIPIKWRRSTLCITATVALMLLACSAGAAVAASNPVSPPFTECPAIGASPSCEILLIVNQNNTISVVGDSTVGPYDGGDDTLIGIVNKSSFPVPAITVSGPGSDLAGFDGDGICTYATGGIDGSTAGFTGDNYCDAQQLAGTDPEDYAGPDNTYTLDPKSQDDVEVDFNGKGLAAGGSTYFSLEGALTAAVITARKGGLIPSATSPNWAGYVSQYPPRNPVSARVTLPRVTCDTAGDVSMWVGYDGWEKDSSTVEQDGITASCTWGGTPSFYLWYELFKSHINNHNPCYATHKWCPLYTNPYEIRVPVRVGLQPGDSVDLFVNKIPHASLHGIPLGTDKIFFSIAAYNPAGKAIMSTWTKTVSEPLLFGPKYDSSECIAEAPGESSGLQAMPNFGSITFTNCSAIDDVKSPSNLLRVDMERNGKVLATTNRYSRNNNGQNSFSATWVASK
jgi:Peptidase A4 family